MQLLTLLLALGAAPLTPAAAARPPVQGQGNMPDYFCALQGPLRVHDAMPPPTQVPDASISVERGGQASFSQLVAVLLVSGSVVAFVLFKGSLKAAVAMLYLTLSVAIDVSIAAQRSAEGSQSGFDFDPVCVVLLTELIKLVVSLLLYQGCASWTGAAAQAKLHFSDVAWFTLPAAFFTLNNILVFWALGENEVTVFSVFRDTMIIWTAIIWRFVFGTPLGSVRHMSIVGIVFGLALNRAGSTLNGNLWSWAFLWVMLMTLCNALGSVANEFALKRSQKLDINLQNTVLHTACSVVSLLFLIATNPGRLWSVSAFVAGLSRWTLLTCGLQAFAGLVVSRLLKYTDAVWKTAAACLRGPILVVIVVIFPTQVPAQHDVIALVSSFVVAASGFMYLLQGPIQASVPEDAEKTKGHIEFVQRSGCVVA